MFTPIRLACLAAAFALSGCMTAKCIEELGSEPIYAKVPIVGGCAVADVIVSPGALLLLGVESVASTSSAGDPDLETERRSPDGRWQPPPDKTNPDDPMRTTLWDLAQAEYAYQKRLGEEPPTGVLVGKEEMLFFNDTDRDIRFVLTSPRMATRTFHIKAGEATAVQVQPDTDNIVTVKLATGDKKVERELHQGEMYYLFYDVRDQRYDIGQIQLAEEPEDGRFREPKGSLTAAAPPQKEESSGFVGAPVLPEGTNFGRGGLLSNPTPLAAPEPLKQQNQSEVPQE